MILVALVKVNPTVALGVERNSNYVFYSLLEEGRAVLNEIIADQVPVFKTIRSSILQLASPQGLVSLGR
jgi:hypothetical protein